MDEMWVLLLFITPLFLIIFYLEYMYGKSLYQQYAPSMKSRAVNPKSLWYDRATT